MYSFILHDLLICIVYMFAVVELLLSIFYKANSNLNLFFLLKVSFFSQLLYFVSKVIFSCLYPSYTTSDEELQSWLEDQ